MIRLTRLGDTDLAQLNKLRQKPGQYADHGATMILDPTPGISFHAIHADDDLIGMFKLDPFYHQRHDFATETQLGLRGVLIDETHQGKGYGTSAMCALPDHARLHYPDMRQIVLTVNLLNPSGRAAYLKAGFADLGEIYYGGSRGPQHILRRDLLLRDLRGDA
ncbi:GNAT family N-acetyltransferase [Paracoccus aminophilus]|uniref:Acetyltransferase n=1 Tax=Paracoccus aminophilus JCM 7686 TaxID=1367847 RepID=S5XTD6_PARAH|nr:GNAT family protein [Paracoccus aminophilus]AGT08432.1 acetyltransferase [Paracoccus aminophilus JCM 7686]